MRALSSLGASLLARAQAGEQIPHAQCIEVQFSSGTVYLTTAGGPIEAGGRTWLPAGIGAIDAIEDAAGDMPGLRFSLPGITPAQVAVALEPEDADTPVRVYDVLIDPDTGQAADPVPAWVGALDVPTLRNGRNQADLTVNAEHRGVRALRPKQTRYTDEEQQRRYPGDTSLAFDPATDAAPLAWPQAGWFDR